MRNVWKKLAAVWMCLTILCTMVPAAVAEGTTLEITLTGLWAMANGQWRSVPLTGSFDVAQGGESLGRIVVGEKGSNALQLKDGSNVTLVPVADTMPEGYLIHASGYMVAVTEGQRNMAPMMVYADAGMFTLQAQGQCAFELTAEDGTVTEIRTDDKGFYASTEAMPSGVYTVAMTDAADGVERWPDFELTLKAYMGQAADVTAVDAAYAGLTALSTPELTATPTAEPTATHTAEPTATPTAEPTATPTAEPTATPTAEPTATPTAEPTATPTAAPTATPEPAPATGKLVLHCDGEAKYQLMLGSALVTEGELSPDAPAEIDGLTPGGYTVLILLDDHMAMTSLNSFAVATEGQAAWQTEISANVENAYTVGLSSLVTLTGAMDEDISAQASASCQYDSASAAAENGAYQLTNLIPGEYTVTLQLPAGDYLGEGWSFTEADGVVSATLTLMVEADTVLPSIAKRATAGISGRIDADGKAANASVTLMDETGAVVAQTTADDNGAWSFTGLMDGSYVLHTEVEGLNAADEYVTLGAGQQLADMVIAAGKPGSVKILVFQDGNNNGFTGKYEAGLVNVTVGAVPADNPSAGPVATAVTNKKGYATIENLAPGEYVIRAQLPAGFGFAQYGAMDRQTASIMQESDQQLQDSAAFTLQAGEKLEYGIGVMPMAVVSGYVWHDVNADGQRQADEPGQAGCRIELVLRGGDTMYELVTGEDGNYVFGAVQPGEYNIRATTPEGLMFTKYTKYGGDRRSILTAEGDNQATKLVNLKSGTNMDQQNIGLITESIIQVQCFLDANYNGLYDEGEAPLEGVKAELLKQGNGKTVATKHSGADGVIVFNALRANTYRLRAVLPEGAAFTMVSSEEAGNHFEAREGRRENYADNIVVETGTTTQMVVGAVLPATITGACYLDNDFSATKNDKEPAVVAINVTLLDAQGEKVDTVRTNNQGVYRFENINPGSYTISLNAKRGYAFTKLGEGNVILNTGDGEGVSEAFEVPLGAAVTGMDAGMILPGTVQGVVFADENDNGLQDQGERGLTGTMVRLMGEEGEFFAAEIGEDGVYCFDAVMPGRYYLRYELPENGIFAQHVQGGNTIQGENRVGAGEWFDFSVGSKVDAPLCGALILGQVDGVAFADHNGSGLQDADEAVLAGVTLTLTPAREDLQPITAVSDENGAFLLADVHPDTYTLTVLYPEGLVMSRTDALTLPVNPGFGSQDVELPVAMGATWLGQLLGGVAPSCLEGTLWLDENNDGVRDADEATPAGETVEIIDQQTGSVYAELTTNEEGGFAIDGLIPGEYTVRFALDENTIAPKAGDATFREEEGALVMRDVLLSEGEDTDGLLLGIVRYTNLGGKVWVDQAGEITLLQGAEVTLEDGEGRQVATVETDENGSYVFGQLLPGQYVVSVTLPEGQVVVEPDDERLSGDLVSVMTQCSGRSGASEIIEVRMGQDQMDLDIGSVLPGRLGDFAWLDLDGNGLQDFGEGGIPGVKVELLRGGETVAETVTDQYGYYLFTEVYPAAYTLRVTAPSQVKPTEQREGYAGISSVLTGEDGETVESAEITVSSARNNYDADLGFVLRKKNDFPAGYGEGQTQDWTKIRVD